MDTQLDVVAKQLGAPASRRRVVRDLGALGLSTLGIVGLSQTTAANGSNSRHHCLRRCKDHCNANSSNRQCRDQCHRQCD